ncbi:PEP-CTERM sorting domain-containing protein [Agarivorans aestuarii]|uniref:PEP-CTERM sorting domain-containing protein n=2 Tax=Agarivorans aestuarii TaxID=1563703 RepID=A0ABU7G239_9ALTE|nr:PEP-CTERM sorting domain-containing protein [Agarivorans aestuarii]
MPTYKGFNFSSTLDWLDLEGSSWNYGAKNGEFGILNNNGGVGIITEQNGADFTFDGLWAKVWATGKESGGTDSAFGILQGYRDGVLEWSVDTSLNGSYEFYGAQAGLIDELRLGFGGIFLVDDIVLNEDVPATVSEPATLAIFGLGLLGLGFARKRKVN